MPNFTNTFIASLRPAEKPYELADSQLRGLSIRVTGKAKAFYCRYRLVDGKQGRARIGDAAVLTVTQARERARILLADASKGENPAAKKREARAHTLRSFLDEEYGPWLKANRKSGAYMYIRLKAGCEPLLDKKLHELTPWIVEKWLADYRRRGAIVSGNRHLAYLKSCLTRAVEWEYLELNPITKVKKSKEDTRAKVRYLDADEERRLLEALDNREARMRNERENHNSWCRERHLPEGPELKGIAFADYLKPMAILSLNTGLRRGEVFSLEWRDVDFERGIITIRGEAAKSGFTRHIPMNSVARETLLSWRGQTAGIGLVFVSARTQGRFDSVETSWKTVLKAASIQAFRWHDMRHHFASKLVMAGVDLNTVRELLGHSDIKMTLRYAHLAPQAKAAAVEKIVIDPAAADNVVEFKAKEA